MKRHIINIVLLIIILATSFIILSCEYYLDGLISDWDLKGPEGSATFRIEGVPFGEYEDYYAYIYVFPDIENFSFEDQLGYAKITMEKDVGAGIVKDGLSAVKFNTGDTIRVFGWIDIDDSGDTEPTTGDLYKYDTITIDDASIANLFIIQFSELSEFTDATESSVGVKFTDSSPQTGDMIAYLEDYNNSVLSVIKFPQSYNQEMIKFIDDYNNILYFPEGTNLNVHFVIKPDGYNGVNFEPQNGDEYGVEQITTQGGETIVDFTYNDLSTYYGNDTCADPTFTPASGSKIAMGETGAVTIATTTAPDCTIYYTTDGTEPTASSTEYTADVDAPATETTGWTVKAIAIADTAGWTDSAVATATYDVIEPTNNKLAYLIVKVNGTSRLPDGSGLSSANGFEFDPNYCYSLDGVDTGTVTGFNDETVNLGITYKLVEDAGNPTEDEFTFPYDSNVVINVGLSTTIDASATVSVNDDTPTSLGNGTDEDITARLTPASIEVTTSTIDIAVTNGSSTRVYQVQVKRAAQDMVTVTGTTDGSYTQEDTGGNSFVHNISDFDIGKYEVTYELWYEVYQWAISTGFNFANAGREGNDGTDGAAPTASKYEPVTYVNWRDVMVWCNAYSEMTGKTPCYTYNSSVIKDSRDSNATACDNAVCDWSANGYRLPTEGEWQYAASYIDGSSWLAPDHVSGDESAPYDTSTVFGDYAWYDGNSGSSTHDVGTKNANALGLHDMSGNVFEWCWDWHDDYPTSAETDYRGAVSGSNRVSRGGIWNSGANYLQVGYRSSGGPSIEDYYIGFRLVRVP